MPESICDDGSTSGGFSLLSNPFILLQVSPNATAQEIKQAFEDAIEDEIAPTDVLQRAQQTLLIPRLRVDSEVGGLLDVGPQISSQVISKLKAHASWAEFDEILDTLPALPRSNLLAHLGSESPMGAAQVFQLLEAKAAVTPESIYDAVIDTRRQTGIGTVDRDAIAEALERIEERQINAVVNTLSGTNTFAKTFTAFVKCVLAKGKSSLVAKLDTFMNAYNRAAASELSTARTSDDCVRRYPHRSE